MLSELHGRIGQILREKGDMKVVRPVRRELESISTTGPYCKELTSESFVFEAINFYTEDGNKFDTQKLFIVNVL